MKQNFADELNRDDDVLHKEIFDLDLPPLPPPPTREVVPDGAIVPAEHGWLYRQFELTPVGVRIAEGTNEDEWIDLGNALFKLRDSMQWILGDWLAFGERKFKKTYKDVAVAYNYDVDSLYQYVWVCKKFDISIRIETLYFGHYQAVAGKSPEERQYWLERARVGKWTISQMRAAMKGDPPAPPTPSQLALYKVTSAGNEMAALVSRMMGNPAERDDAKILLLSVIDSLEEQLTHFRNLARKG